MAAGTSTAPSPGRRARRRLAAVALAATVAVALTGCMKMDVALTLHDDDTADGSMVMAVSDDFAKSIGQDPQTLWDQIGSELESDVGDDGTTTEPYHEGGYTGTRFVVERTPISELSDGPLGDAADGDTLSVTRDGDEFVVSGSVDMSEDLADQGSDLPSGVDAGDVLDVRLSFTFPGAVVSADDAATVDGRTVTWRLDPTTRSTFEARGSAVADGSAAGDGAGAGQTQPTEAGAVGPDGTVPVVADAPGGGSLAWLWVVLGVAALAVVALVLRLVTRTPRPAVPAADPGAAYAAQAGYAPSAQPGPQTAAPPVEPNPYAPPADQQQPPRPPAPPLP